MHGGHPALWAGALSSACPKDVGLPKATIFCPPAGSSGYPLDNPVIVKIKLEAKTYLARHKLNCECVLFAITTGSPILLWWPEGVGWAAGAAGGAL